MGEKRDSNLEDLVAIPGSSRGSWVYWGTCPMIAISILWDGFLGIQSLSLSGWLISLVALSRIG